MDFYKEIASLEIGNNTESLSYLGNLIWSFAEVGYDVSKLRVPSTLYFFF